MPLFLHDDELKEDSDVVVELVDLEKDNDVTGSSQGSKVPSLGTATKQRRVGDIREDKCIKKRISQCWRCFEKHLKKSLMKGIKGVFNQ
jgi:hypothetical protein